MSRTPRQRAGFTRPRPYKRRAAFTTRPCATRFAVCRGMGCWHIYDVAASAMSFIMVPEAHTWRWNIRADARSQAAYLNRRLGKGERIRLRMERVE